MTDDAPLRMAGAACGIADVSVPFHDADKAAFWGFQTTISRLLSALPPRDRPPLVRQLTLQRFAANEVVFRKGDRPEHIVIPIDVVLANVMRQGDRRVCTTGIVGRDSLSDLTSLIFDSPVAWDVQVVHAGAGWILPKVAIQLAPDPNPHLHALLMRLFHAATLDIAQNFLCATAHDLAQRTARWLLEESDREGNFKLRIRQDELAALLAVQRSSINQAFQDLRRRGATSTARGWVTIQDRDILTQQACHCYAPKPFVN